VKGLKTLIITVSSCIPRDEGEREMAVEAESGHNVDVRSEVETSREREIDGFFDAFRWRKPESSVLTRNLVNPGS
jgi:hypothetical protein